MTGRFSSKKTLTPYLLEHLGVAEGQRSRSAQLTGAAVSLGGANTLVSLCLMVWVGSSVFGRSFIDDELWEEEVSQLFMNGL